MSTPKIQPNGKAQTMRTAFSRETAVSTDIAADAAIVWALLTQAADYPRWNPTVLSIQGDIQEGATIHLVSALAPKRSFKLRVRDVVSQQQMTWADAQGKRVYTLSPTTVGVCFTMRERIAGPLFPLFAALIPPFDKAFEEFAAALKREAELIQSKQQ